jgi:hypothetical protein
MDVEKEFSRFVSTASEFYIGEIDVGDDYMALL